MPTGRRGNPYHDSKGRFTNRGAAKTVSVGQSFTLRATKASVLSAAASGARFSKSGTRLASGAVAIQKSRGVFKIRGKKASGEDVGLAVMRITARG